MSRLTALRMPKGLNEETLIVLSLKVGGHLRKGFADLPHAHVVVQPADEALRHQQRHLLLLDRLRRLVLDDRFLLLVFFLHRVPSKVQMLNIIKENISK